MKTAILYYSAHHENTAKLLTAIAAQGDVTLIDSTKTDTADLTDFDIIGIASGIYYSKFGKSVTELARKCLPRGKRVFAIFTCGSKRKGYTDEIFAIAQEKGCAYVGEYGCNGYDTFGPFKLIGGIAKGHPDENDIKGAVEFYKGIAKGEHNEEK